MINLSHFHKKTIKWNFPKNVQTVHTFFKNPYNQDKASKLGDNFKYYVHFKFGLSILCPCNFYVSRPRTTLHPRCDFLPEHFQNLGMQFLNVCLEILCIWTKTQPL